MVIDVANDAVTGEGLAEVSVGVAELAEDNVEGVELAEVDVESVHLAGVIAGLDNVANDAPEDAVAGVEFAEIAA